MLKQRIISAFFMFLVFVVVNFYTSDIIFALAMGLLAAFAGWEWSRFAGLKGSIQQIAFGGITALVSIILVPVMPWAAGSAGELPALAKPLSLAVALFWMAVACLFYIHPAKQASSGKTEYLCLLAGLFLLGTCMYFSVLLHTVSLGGSAFLFMYAMFTVWVMDVGAYFAGKRFGKHKLAPRISPGKTWEGVAGGILGAFLFAFVTLQLADFAADNTFALVLATVFAAAASILGDLYESRMKRAVGFKDSSHLIPGHGGVLDRIDGVIAAIPVFAFAWIWL